MPSKLVLGLFWIVVLGVGFSLRIQNLEERPIHADEATGARILAQRLEDSSYQFNPKHFHGPILSLSSLPIAQLKQETSWQELSLSTLRLGTVVAGTLLILSPLIWSRLIGETAALTAAAFLATSPLLVYYSRMYIHETWLALFGMLACGLFFQTLLKPSYTKALLCGLAIGLMFATKETFVISIFSWCIAGVALVALRKRTLIQQSLREQATPYLKPGMLLIVSATLAATLLYTNGLRSPQGIVDAIKTYFVYETTPGHEKPFTDYASLLIWPKQALGTYWSEGLLLFCSALSIALTCKHKALRTSTGFLTVATVLQFLVYSLIGYKTPWLMVLPWAHVCLLAGILFADVRKHTVLSKYALYALLVGALAWQTNQSLKASGPFANDSRNPYAYVPTSKDLHSVESWLAQLANNHPPKTLEPIGVVGSGYWPLPWYLRDFESIGYWPEATKAIQACPIVFAMPEAKAASETLLESSHTSLPRGLRADVSMTLFIRKDLWEAWIHQ